MRGLIQRLLDKAVKEYVERLFTYRNLQAVRDRFVQSVDAAVVKTETPYDDLIWSITRRLLDDDNLAELYNWIKTNCAYVNSIDKTCKAPAIDFAGLQDVLEVTEPNKAASIQWVTVVEVLRVIIPILIDWYNKQ